MTSDDNLDQLKRAASRYARARARLEVARGERDRALAQAIGDGVSVTDAARTAGISREATYRALERAAQASEGVDQGNA